VDVEGTADADAVAGGEVEGRQEGELLLDALGGEVGVERAGAAGAADRVLRVPTVDRRLDGHPAGPERAVDVTGPDEVPGARCGGRLQCLDQGSDGGFAPLHDAGIFRRAFQRGAVRLGPTEDAGRGPAVHATDVADQAGDVPPWAARHRSVQGTLASDGDQAGGLVADDAFMVDPHGRDGTLLV
jgi:hypothetical protein